MATSRIANEASSSSSFPSSKSWIYDVFLSFRGKDTRRGFTDNLYMTLTESGISTFLDANELRRGENINEELVQAIQRSKISVIVFSRKYAESRWCLEELVKIMECRRTLGQIVLPIFYDVAPSDVRKQTGTFAESFDQKHKDKDEDKVKRWRAALTEAANLSGWDLRNTADGHEGQFIRKIRDEITRHLISRTPLHVAEHQVGIDSRMQDIIFHLGVGTSDDVRMVGIWGMGGVGKTLVAKAVYNHMFRRFEASSFLANVRETSKESKGKVTLQNKFLSDISNKTKRVVDEVDEGINVIKEKIGCRSILVIIDDVDKQDQLHDLAIHRKFFGPGSRIIITTRDKQLLEQLEVDTTYAAREMNQEESLVFFSLHAFKNHYPDEGYADISRTVVDYCGGLPLAIKVLGSFLFKRNTVFWESTIKKLGKIPHLEIQEKLKISFDGLNDETEKDIFLDISCFFIGMDVNYVKHILDGCGFFPDSGIEVLTQRCLVTVGETNELEMHDLVRDMGRGIVRSKSPEYPGKRCRLWDDADATDVLRDKSGSEELEGLTLKMLTSDAKARFSTKAFSKMKRLRLLKLNYVLLTGGYKYVCNKLHWLCWHGFPSKFIPKDFSLRNVVAIDLQYSNLTHLWEDSRLLQKLKILDLSHSHYLTDSPDFLKLPNLENLALEDCTSLSEVDQSIGNLDRLSSVNLKGCIMLKDLPRSFYKLKAMRTLLLVGCSRFEKLDDDLGDMVSLTTLDAYNTSIRKIPSSIVRLKNLARFSLSCLEPNRTTLRLPPSFRGLNSLTELYLRGCNLSGDSIPNDLGSLYSLEILDLGENSFHNLSSLGGLSKLWHLNLFNCTSLQEVPELPTSLKNLLAGNCPALERLPDFSKLSLGNFSVGDSSKVTEISGLEKLLNSVQNFNLEGCTGLSTTLKDTILQRWNYIGQGGITLPGYDIPEWFTSVNEGDTVFFHVPPISGSNVIALTLCVSYSPLSCSFTSSIALDGIYVTNHTKRTCFIYRPLSTLNVTSCIDFLWLGHLQNHKLNLEGGDFVELFIEVGSNNMKQTHLKVRKIGVGLVWDTNREEFRLSDPTKFFTAPYCPIGAMGTLTWVQQMAVDLQESFSDEDLQELQELQAKLAASY